MSSSVFIEGEIEMGQDTLGECVLEYSNWNPSLSFVFHLIDLKWRRVLDCLMILMRWDWLLWSHPFIAFTFISCSITLRHSSFYFNSSLFFPPLVLMFSRPSIYSSQQSCCAECSFISSKTFVGWSEWIFNWCIFIRDCLGVEPWSGVIGSILSWLKVD